MRRPCMTRALTPDLRRRLLPSDAPGHAPFRIPADPAATDPAATGPAPTGARAAARAGEDGRRVSPAGVRRELGGMLVGAGRRE
jgi:hypothetical protein